METLTPISAFLVGLLGGVHCVGMCGGIVGALSIGFEASPSNKPHLLYLFAYNIARISSYTIAGVIFGWLGASLVDMVAINTGQQILKIIAGVFMILLGLYLANWWRVLIRLESVGAKMWKFIEPLGRKLIPIKSTPQAFTLGLVWGWLPCGLVYSVLIWSLSSGGAIEGGTLMLAFGLGTLPNLLLMGVLASSMRSFMQQAWIKSIAGLFVIGFGVFQIYQASQFL